jgi:hypothetical protein
MSSSGRAVGSSGAAWVARAALVAATLLLAGAARAGGDPAGGAWEVEAAPAKAPEGGAPVASPYARYARASRERGAPGRAPRRMLRLSVRGAQKAGRSEARR